MAGVGLSRALEGGSRRGSRGAARRRERARRRRRWWWWTFLIAAGLGLWAALPRPRFLERWPPPTDGFEPWRPVFLGVDYARGHFAHPRPMKCHAIRVDLQAPGVSVFVKPGGRNIVEDTTSQTATSFLREHGLQVAVSTTAFWPFVKLPGRPVDLVGLAVSDGDRYSEPVTNLDCLVVTRANQARIVGAGGETADAWNGAGGMLTTLRGGTNVAERLGRDAASVAGVSADGRHLFWLIVDGRQPGYSEGATAEETADMLRGLGASDALNMDGGSVCTLAMDGGWRGARVVNQPCHPVLTGWQRPIGGLLGIRARPLP